MNDLIGISIGDVTGIGPEVALKAIATAQFDPSVRFTLIGDADYLERLNAKLKLGISFSRDPEHGRVRIVNPLSAPLPSDLTAGSPAAAEAAMEWLKYGADKCLHQELDALVTAPVNKESIIRSGQPFIGQTEFLSRQAGCDHTRMMLMGSDEKERWIRVTLVTTHVPLECVAQLLTTEKVEETIELTVEACSQLGLKRARVAVCGLNPHAGEGGKVGREELDIISPAVKRAQAKGLDVHGPVSADTLFYQALRGDYDAVVAMYHDQGLIPVKLIGFENGVNWTVGLPFIRTSPDHGTAYDIAGLGKADPSSMISAIRLALRLAARKSTLLTETI